MSEHSEKVGTEQQGASGQAAEERAEGGQPGEKLRSWRFLAPEQREALDWVAVGRVERDDLLADFAALESALARERRRVAALEAALIEVRQVATIGAMDLSGKVSRIVASSIPWTELGADAPGRGGEGEQA